MRLRHFVGHAEVEAIEPGAQLVLHLSQGIKLVVENNGDGPVLSVAGVHRERIIEVYDRYGEELCQIPVRAGVG